MAFSGDYSGIAYAHDQFTVSNTAKGVDEDGVSLTSGPTNCIAVIIYTSTAIRYTIDGTTPTATVGMPVAAGATFIVTGPSNVDNLKLIRQATDSTVDCTYLRA